MSKKVPYKVIGRHSIPGDKDSQIKYYASVNVSGDMTTNEIVERLQLESTLTKADILAVLAALENVIIDSLSSGQIVRLADLGTLSIGLSSEGTDLEKNFNSSLIKEAHIKFRAGRALRSFLKNLTYYKLNPVTPGVVEEPAPVADGSDTTAG